MAKIFAALLISLIIWNVVSLSAIKVGFEYSSALRQVVHGTRWHAKRKS